MLKSEEFIGQALLDKMQKAEKEHPATQHTSAGGWCKHCGCGNDVLGYRRLPSCKYGLRFEDLI